MSRSQGIRDTVTKNHGILLQKMNESNTKLSHSDSRMHKEITQLNETLTQHMIHSNISVASEQSRATQAENHLGHRISALESLLLPLVDLVQDLASLMLAY